MWGAAGQVAPDNSKNYTAFTVKAQVANKNLKPLEPLTNDVA